MTDKRCRIDIADDSVEAVILDSTVVVPDRADIDDDTGSAGRNHYLPPLLFLIEDLHRDRLVGQVGVERDIAVEQGALDGLRELAHLAPDVLFSMQQGT